MSRGAEEALQRVIGVIFAEVVVILAVDVDRAGAGGYHGAVGDRGVRDIVDLGGRSGAVETNPLRRAGRHSDVNGLKIIVRPNEHRVAVHSRAGHHLRGDDVVVEAVHIRRPHPLGSLGRKDLKRDIAGEVQNVALRPRPHDHILLGCWTRQPQSVHRVRGGRGEVDRHAAKRREADPVRIARHRCNPVPAATDKPADRLGSHRVVDD